VEAIAPISPTKPGIARTVYFLPALLSRNARDGELRVCVAVFTENGCWVDRRRVIEGDAECFGAIDALQDIHVVGERCSLIAIPQSIIPA